jgi:beta-N-acetylhexosaminidase
MGEGVAVLMIDLLDRALDAIWEGASQTKRLAVRGWNGLSRYHQPRQRIVIIAALFALLVTAGFSANPSSSRSSTPQSAQASPTRIIITSTLSPTAQPTPVPAVPKTLADLADQYIATMSLDDKLGQLFIPTFLCCGYTKNTATMVEKLHTGGFILYSANLQNASQARALIAAAKAHSIIPPLITLDEEGGGVDRLKDIYGPRPSARTIANSRSTTYALNQGAQVARDMAALGFNVNFAPDVDIQLVRGPDLGSRNFGTDSQTVITYAGAYLTGMQNNGVLGTLKHFPGLGAATIDAHAGLPIINRTRAQIEETELAPYRALIATGQVGAIMSTDLLMPALDPNLPAELSPTIIDGVLRHDLGFDGVVITDALYMDGITQRYSMNEAGVLAILAGCDMLEGPMTPAQMTGMINALKTALSSGRLTEARIDLSVQRILVLKMRMGLISVPLSNLAPTPAIGSMQPVNGSGLMRSIPPSVSAARNIRRLPTH